MHNIFVYISSKEEYNFFQKFNKAIKEVDGKLYFVTHIPSLYAKLLLLPYTKTFFLFSLQKDKKVKKMGKMLINEFRELLFQVCEKKITENKINLVFILNGHNIVSEQLLKIAKGKKIDKLFFELANIPGKLFVDNVGVNAQSSLYNDISKLEKYDVSKNEFDNWLKGFINLKISQESIPQAKKLSKVNIWYIFDMIYFKFIRFNAYGDYSLSNKLKFYFLQKDKTNYDLLDINKSRYIFFPLQVSDDSQLKINSDYDNIEALYIAKELAEKNNCDLVVKFHPAEQDNRFVYEILTLRYKLNFKILNYNTYELIQNSQLVFSINSTVGLESIIFGKEVIFIGRTFYSKLNERYLRNYLLSYLVDIDFWSKEKVNLSALQEVLDRIK